MTCGRLLPPGDFKNLALVLEEILRIRSYEKPFQGAPTQPKPYLIQFADAPSL